MTEASDKQTPPPLHYSPSLGDHDHSSTRESTPIGTPVVGQLSFPRRPDRGKDFASWYSSKLAASGNRPSYFDSAIVDSDLEDDPIFPLFPSSPPIPPPSMMDGHSNPLDITSRQTSGSPSGQHASNLTSALQLQRAAFNDPLNGASNLNGNSAGVMKTAAGRKDSLSASIAQWGNGTKPISVMGSNREKPRRESLAGSLVGGMSWGGVSVGSWIRDDIIMAGTSPFTLQSPSYHSSSYLPKLEANFMRDFLCCGLTLPTLHDLLQHYEEAHAQKTPQSGQRNTQADSRAALAIAAATSAQQQRPVANTTQIQPEQQPMTQPSLIPSQLAPQPGQIDAGAFGTGPINLDLDTIDDMEMDDAMGLTDTSSAQLFGSNSRDQGFVSDGTRVTPLNLGILQGQALRNSQPGTPIATAHTLLQNNPTVSSVNTPTLMANPLHNAQYRATPDSSAPGTPAELDETVVASFGDLTMQGNLGHPPSFNGLGVNNDMLDLCIDEPAKRLYSPNGAFGSSSQVHLKLGNSQYAANSDIARRIREQQLLAGVPDMSAGMLTTEEPKPFRCPVIGCEKAYKNQNGLKYHKAHGHNNQQLHDNADGTFSIVNPETSAPYPGTLGMEKEKPYRCEVCGKRYKNLNGLKYHKLHSPPCNPDLQLGVGRNLNLGGVMQGQNINVAGVGLPGIGEECLM